MYQKFLHRVIIIIYQHVNRKSKTNFYNLEQLNQLNNYNVFTFLLKFKLQNRHLVASNLIRYYLFAFLLIILYFF